MDLINKLTIALQPNYQVVVSDIPENYINSPFNTTKSTKCIDIRKDDAIFIEFYYNEFTPAKIKEEANFWLSHNDRDMDHIIMAHFKTIANILNQL
jgi:hypothetical protein